MKEKKQIQKAKKNNNNNNYIVKIKNVSLKTKKAKDLTQ